MVKGYWTVPIDGTLRIYIRGVVNYMSEVARGSDSEEWSVAERKTPSASHVRFFKDRSEYNREVTANNRRSASPPSGRQIGARLTCVD